MQPEKLEARLSTLDGLLSYRVLIDAPATVVLRDVDEADLADLFEHQQDVVAAEMAAFRPVTAPHSSRTG